MKKYLIVYHQEDNDGCCSAGLLKHYVVSKLGVSPDLIDYFPATYAILDKVAENNFADFEGYDFVVMTDVSFNNFSDMVKLYEKLGKENFAWIDHHAPVIQKSIETKYDTLINGERNIYKSAILNAYRYCFDPLNINYLSGKAPLVLRYLSAWDSWTYDRENLNFDNCRYINTGFTRESKLDPEYWYKMMPIFLDPDSEDFVDDLIDKMLCRGFEECRVHDEANEKLVKQAGMPGFTVNGNRSCIVLFTSGGTSSLLFKSVRGQYDNALCVKSHSSGRVIVSLYNVTDTHDFHCGTYLQKKYNGGGHEGAAGATITFEQLNEILQTKQI